ncbi:MAG: M14 family zinc carboxypeptidase [Planctomycetota bacterium]
MPKTSAVRLCALLLILVVSATLPAQVSVYFNQEGMRLRSGIATQNGARWSVALTMEDDNVNASLGSSFRRWWACGIRGLGPNGETLDIAVSNAGYTDVILPVWSQSSDGVHFSAWARMPSSATPTVSGSTHRFTLVTPPGVTEIRIAKYFPWSIAEKDALLQRVAAATGIGSVQVIGASTQGRSIGLATLTDARVPLSRKRRVWVHAGIHPSETTSYFVVEGLVDELLSGSVLSRILLANVVFDIVPMSNPDGVALGNYRTTATSANLEEEWASPYNSVQPEIIALRTAIEARMGTVAVPGVAPIDLLFNLHSSHNISWPFHYLHTSNASFNLVSNRSGVIPEVNAREQAWIAAMRAHSVFVNNGTTQSSTAGAPTRPFVESMMHDRWSVDPLWRAAHQSVMAITLEGTYGAGPGTTWNTQAQYRQVGHEMAAAIAQMLAVVPGGAAIDDLTFCGVATLGAGFQPGGTRVDLALQAQSGDLAGVFVVGTQTIAVPLPLLGCTLRTDPLLALGVPLDAGGRAVISLQPPLGTTAVRTQGIVLRAGGTSFATSNLFDLLIQR